jgi:hypothetical protein
VPVTAACQSTPILVHPSDGDKLYPTMGDIAEQVFMRTPIPSVILDPSCHIQKASGSFLKYLNLTKDEEWQGVSYTSLLEGANFSETDTYHMRKIINAAIDTCETQIWRHDGTASEVARQIRVVPIQENGILLHLLVEGQIRRGSAEDRLIARGDTGLSTNEAFGIMVT